MAMTAEQYRQAGLQLLPQGHIWDKSEDGDLSAIMNGVAQMLARIDSTAEAITAEAIPSNAMMLLTDYETLAGLSSDIDDETNSTTTRKIKLTAKIKLAGSLSKQSLVQMAAEKGYTINIIERHPHHCKRGVNYPLHPWKNWWLVFIASAYSKPQYATVIDSITTRLTLKNDGKELTEMLEDYKPAHINLVYINEE